MSNKIIEIGTKMLGEAVHNYICDTEEKKLKNNLKAKFNFVTGLYLEDLEKVFNELPNDHPSKKAYKVFSLLDEVTKKQCMFNLANSYKSAMDIDNNIAAFEEMIESSRKARETERIIDPILIFAEFI